MTAVDLTDARGFGAVLSLTTFVKEQAARRTNGARRRAPKQAQAVASRCAGRLPLRSSSTEVVEAVAETLARAKQLQTQRLQADTTGPVEGYSRSASDADDEAEL